MEERRYNMVPNEIADKTRQTDQDTNDKKNAFDEKNYLNVKLKDDENEKKIKFRLMNIGAGENDIFKGLESHSIKLSPEMQKAMKLKTPYKSYHCLAKTKGLDEKFGHDCPFCEENKKAYAEFDAERKKENPIASEVERLRKKSLSMLSHSCVIMRGIERGKEADGPKFLKVNLHSDKTDAYHVLMDFYTKRRDESMEEKAEEMLDQYGSDTASQYFGKTVEKVLEMWKKDRSTMPKGFVPYNIFDLYNGKDFEITITRLKDSSGKYLERTSLKIVDCGNPKPLAVKNGEPDYERINAWCDDPKKWSEVFPAKPYEYLRLLMDNKYPYYNKNEERWIGAKLNKDGTYELPWAKKKQEERAEREAEMDRQIEEAERAESSYVDESTGEVMDNDDTPFGGEDKHPYEF